MVKFLICAEFRGAALIRGRRSFWSECDSVALIGKKMVTNLKKSSMLAFDHTEKQY